MLLVVIFPLLTGTSCVNHSGLYETKYFLNDCSALPKAIANFRENDNYIFTKNVNPYITCSDFLPYDLIPKGSGKEYSDFYLRVEKQTCSLSVLTIALCNGRSTNEPCDTWDSVNEAGHAEILRLAFGPADSPVSPKVETRYIPESELIKFCSKN